MMRHAMRKSARAATIKCAHENAPLLKTLVLAIIGPAAARHALCHRRHVGALLRVAVAMLREGLLGSATDLFCSMISHPLAALTLIGVLVVQLAGLAMQKRVGLDVLEACPTRH